jgi:colicin import membrane protein
LRGGLATSVVLHAAILGWALITIPSQRELRVAEPEPIAVDLVSISEHTRLRQGVRTAKQLEAQPKESKAEPARKEAPKPTPAATAPPPPPPEPDPPAPKEEPKEVAAVPPPPPAPAAPPVPSPEDQKKFEEMLKEQQQAEERRKAEEQKRLEEEQRRQAELKKKQEEARKRAAELKKKREEEKKRKEAEAKKKQFDADKISALLNKMPDKGAPTPSVPLDQQAKAKGPVLGAPEGRDKQLSASELAVLKQIIRSCVGPKWNVFGGGEEAQNTVVKIRVIFHPDGRLAAAPQVVNPQNTPFFLASAESALRAVQACEPYPLPPDKYSVWRDTILTLNPRDMF